MRDAFGDSPYILLVNYEDEACETFITAYGYPALRNCEGSYYKNESNYVIGKLEDNGSATLEFYEEEKCLSTSWSSTATVNKATLESHACDAKTKWCRGNFDLPAPGERKARKPFDDHPAIR
ncbi:hypothetical protein PI125_g11931 [Phytophthora idaei]|nr:hypothetical protein PI125_g11931 [Phytophthora idaei]KAG3151299.1 hypothetical protein PI126_g11079 [Phytophthora idaei]